MENRNTTTDLIDLLESFTDYIQEVFDVKTDKAFIVAGFILCQAQLPIFGNLSDIENKEIKTYYDKFKEIKYKPSEMRRAYREAYLFSLRFYEEINVDITLELPLIYFKLITETIAKHYDFEHVAILNPFANDGALACMLAISDVIKEEDLYVVEEREEFLKLTDNLRDLIGFKYKTQSMLPRISFRSDIIVSDPFLRSVEDILIFFTDYTEYLNNNGFIIVSLMDEFVRSRVFTDCLENHGLVLIGIIAYPKDLIGGLIKSSIVILEKKEEANKEFFSVEMASIKNINDNIKIIDNIKDYLNKYLGDKKK